MRIARAQRRLVGGALIALVSGCGNDTTSPSPSTSLGVSCTGTAPTQLAQGAHLVVDPATTDGCVSIPVAGATGAEYLVVSLSTTGQVTDGGLTAPYEVSAQATNLTASIAALARANRVASRAASVQSPAARFHAMLRARGRALSRGPRLQASMGRLPSLAATTVTLGSQRTFNVCGDADCQTFVTVTATVKHVGLTASSTWTMPPRRTDTPKATSIAWGRCSMRFCIRSTPRRSGGRPTWTGTAPWSFC